MAGKTPIGPIQEAVSLMSSALTTTDREIEDITARYCARGPEKISPYSLDMIHILTLRHLAYIAGLFRLVLRACEGEDQTLSAFRRDIEEHIALMHREMEDEQKRDRIGYLWTLMSAGIHHVILKHTGEPLFGGIVPKVEALVSEEEVAIKASAAEKTFRSDTVH